MLASLDLEKIAENDLTDQADVALASGAYACFEAHHFAALSSTTLLETLAGNSSGAVDACIMPTAALHNL